MTTATSIPDAVKARVRAMTLANLDPTMPACPSWCQLPAGHPWDSVHGDGLESRGHQGAHFGEYVSTGSAEYNNAVGEQVYDICINQAVEPDVTTPEQARELAANIFAAAVWVEAHQ